MYEKKIIYRWINTGSSTSMLRCDNNVGSVYISDKGRLNRSFPRGTACGSGANYWKNTKRECQHVRTRVKCGSVWAQQILYVQAMPGHRLRRWGGGTLLFSHERNAKNKHWGAIMLQNLWRDRRCIWLWFYALLCSQWNAYRLHP